MAVGLVVVGGFKMLGADITAVEVSRRGDLVEFRLRGQPVVTYVGGPGALPPGVNEVYRRGGYLHPLVTPGGHVVSGDYATNHLHHHGIWTAWTKKEFDGRKPDFWNMGDRKGRVEFVDWLGLTTNAGSAELHTRHRYLDLLATQPIAVLTEDWRVNVQPTPPGTPYVFDIDILQTNITALPLTLSKYHYGGLGFRGRDDWNGAENCFFLTSEGITNRVIGNETRARWCWVGGKVEGGVVAGVTLLSHPDNFRSPEPMRLNPTEPFFCFAPEQLGEFVIPPGGRFHARYRVVVADGPPNAADLDARWQEWAKVRSAVSP